SSVQNHRRSSRKRSEYISTSTTTAPTNLRKLFFLPRRNSSATSCMRREAPPTSSVCSARPLSPPSGERGFACSLASLLRRHSLRSDLAANLPAAPAKLDGRRILSLVRVVLRRFAGRLVH